MRTRRTDPPPTIEECCAVLGVGPGADDHELRRAYRRQLRRFHPDLNGGNHSMREQLARAQQAFRTMEQNLRGIGLHQQGNAPRSRPKEAVEREQKREPAIPPREQIYLLWRKLGSLPLLIACIVTALVASHGARDYSAYQNLFVAAIAFALTMYFTILGALWWWGRK